MAGSVNKVILVGNVGKDPEVRALQDGRRLANFSMATGESWVDKNSGERKERTEWHRIAIFNDRVVDVVEKYVKKGSKVYVEGVLRTRKWTDQQGQERYTTEVNIEAFRGELTLLGDPAGDRGGAGQSDSQDGTQSGQTRSASPAPSDPKGGRGREWGGGGSDLDDEIPFGPEWR